MKVKYRMKYFNCIIIFMILFIIILCHYKS